MAGEETIESAQGGASGGGSSKLLLILTAVNLLITLGVVGALVVSFQKDAKQPRVDDIVADGAAAGAGAKEGAGEQKPEERKFGRMMTLDQFTVNLSTVGSVNPKYARVNISIEVNSEDSEAEITQKMPQVRNTIIDLFNSKRPSDLATAEGRNYLKEEIQNALNSFMVTGRVSGVFFTNFAVSG